MASGIPSPVKSSTPITENPGPSKYVSQMEAPSNAFKQYILRGPVSLPSSPAQASTSLLPSPL